MRVNILGVACLCLLQDLLRAALLYPMSSWEGIATGHIMAKWDRYLIRYLIRQFIISQLSYMVTW